MRISFDWLRKARSFVGTIGAPQRSRRNPYADVLIQPSVISATGELVDEDADAQTGLSTPMVTANEVWARTKWGA